MPLQQIKETEMEIRTRRTVRMPKKYGEGESSRMNPGSSSRIYANASVEAEYHMIAQNWKMQEEEKKIAPKVNVLKKSACITKCGISFVKTLEATSKLTSSTNNSDK